MQSPCSDWFVDSAGFNSASVDVRMLETFLICDVKASKNPPCSAPLFSHENRLGVLLGVGIGIGLPNNGIQAVAPFRWKGFWKHLPFMLGITLAPLLCYSSFCLKLWGRLDGKGVANLSERSLQKFIEEYCVRAKARSARARTPSCTLNRTLSCEVHRDMAKNKRQAYAVSAKAGFV